MFSCDLGSRREPSVSQNYVKSLICPYSRLHQIVTERPRRRTHQPPYHGCLVNILVIHEDRTSCLADCRWVLGSPMLNPSPAAAFQTEALQAPSILFKPSILRPPTKAALHLHIHIYMYIYIDMCTFVHTHTGIQTHEITRVYIYTHTYVYMYANTGRCVHTTIYICKYVSIYKHTHVLYLSISIYLYMYIYTYYRMYTHLYTYIYVYKNVI